MGHIQNNQRDVDIEALRDLSNSWFITLLYTGALNKRFQLMKAIMYNTLSYTLPIHNVMIVNKVLIVVILFPTDIQ